MVLVELGVFIVIVIIRGNSCTLRRACCSANARSKSTLPTLGLSQETPLLQHCRNTAADVHFLFCRFIFLVGIECLLHHPSLDLLRS